MLRTVNSSPTCPSPAPVPWAAIRTWPAAHRGQDALAAGAAGSTRTAALTPLRAGDPVSPQMLADVTTAVNAPARW